MSTPSTPAAPEAPAPKSAAMIEARRREGATKRARVLAVIEQMAAGGTPITVAEVARTAGVSTWLVYAPGVRQAVEAARARQPDHAGAAAQPRPKPDPGAATDLALARAEIGRLRAERDDQRRQLSLALGARMDDLAKADLVARVDELTRHNNQLVAALEKQRSAVRALEARIVGLEDELAAARTSLRRMIRAENLPAPR
jgi:D-alanyl-D-alanine dipeptidase